MNRPHTAHLANESATHQHRFVRTAAAAAVVAADRQLPGVQLRHLFDAQPQSGRRLCAVHIVAGAGDHMHARLGRHLSHERQIALQTVRRVLHDAAAAPAAIPAHIVQHAGVRVRVAEADVVAAGVRVLAHKTAGLQANAVTEVLGQLRRWRLVEAVEVEGEVLVRERPAELVGVDGAENCGRGGRELLWSLCASRR